MARDDPAQIRPVTGANDVASPRDHEVSAGSRIYDIARPLVGANGAAQLGAVTAAFDAASPEIRRILSGLMTDTGESTAAGRIPTGKPAPSNRLALVVLAAITGALVLGATLIVTFAIYSIGSSTNERANAVETRMARIVGETEAVRKQDTQRAKATQSKIDAHDKQIAANAATNRILTSYMIKQIGALGTATGADKLPGWATVPADLGILAAQQRKADEAKSGG